MKKKLFGHIILLFINNLLFYKKKNACVKKQNILKNFFFIKKPNVCPISFKQSYIEHNLLFKHLSSFKKLIDNLLT